MSNRMTEKQILESIQIQELKLSGWRKFSHYSIVGFFVLLSPLFIIFYIRDIINGTAKEFDKMWLIVLIFTIIPLGLGLLYYKIQRKKLRFKLVKTNLTREALSQLIEKVSKELQGSITYFDEKVIEVKTSPSFWSGSWGELITIFFDKQAILINSICDPDKKSSVTSYGRNKKNINRLIEAISEASR